MKINALATCSVWPLIGRRRRTACDVRFITEKINKERAEQQLIETIQKILTRNWMHKREEIKMKIQSGQCSDEEALEWAKEFDALKRNPPQVMTNI